MAFMALAIVGGTKKVRMLSRKTKKVLSTVPRRILFAGMAFGAS